MPKSDPAPAEPKSRQQKREVELEARRESRRRAQLAESEQRQHAQRRRLIIAAVVVAFAALLVYGFRLDRVVGMLTDDAWYVLLAKGLATGQGYSLINSPTPGIIPSYPPGFPWLLSLAWRLAPDFPGNLIYLKLVSVFGMCGASAATWFYFTRARKVPPAVSLGLTAGVLLAPVLVYLATSSVMSECIFTGVQMATFLAIERCAREDDRRGWKYALLAAALASGAFLIRSIAIALLAAGAFYLIKERRWRSVLVFSVAAAALSGPWVIYSRMHQPTPEQRLEQGNGFIVRSYTEQFWDRVAGFDGEGQVEIGDLPARIGANIGTIAVDDIGSMLAAPLYSGPNQGLVERRTAARVLVSLLLAALVLAGFIKTARERLTAAEIAVPLTLALIIAWPFPTFRFIVPFIPLVLFYAAQGARALISLRDGSDPGNWALPGALVWGVVVLHLAGNFNYLQQQYASERQRTPLLTRIFDENDNILQWAGRNLPAEGAVASQNPPLAALFTGRKSVAFVRPAENWESWKRLGVRYILHARPTTMPEPDANESQFNILYRTPGGLNLRAIDLGPVETRKGWVAPVK